MKERPILFSASMVLAILAGTKTQTRRAVRPGTPDDWNRCPYGTPGDKLWVRESFCDARQAAAGRVLYRASGDTACRWKPSIHMPRTCSRIDLDVIGAGVERLQAISEADARAEGIVACYGGFGLPDGSHFHATDPRVSYWSLWDAINGSGSVERNPLVWVVEFRKAHNARLTGAQQHEVNDE